MTTEDQTELQERVQRLEQALFGLRLDMENLRIETERLQIRTR